MTTLKDTDITDAGDEVEAGPGTPDAPEQDKSPTAESTTKRKTAQQKSKPAKKVPEADTEEDGDADTPEKRKIAWSRVFAYRVLPALTVLLAVAAGYLNWSGASAPDSSALRDETVRIGSEDAVALLTYHAASVDKDLSGAGDRLTGDFKDAYSALIRQVVIPGAKEKHISVVAKATAAASVSATESHAVVLVFVNQTVTIGEGAPTDTAPVVRVVLEKVDGRWLVSHFDPV
jgi:Mce-associated membrane protein